MSVLAHILGNMDATERVWLVYDGDLLSVHASPAGATKAKDAYIGRVIAEAQQGEPAGDREYLERHVTIVESPLLP
jgi:hypothetical protein